MDRIPDGSIDAIITDLPYGVLHKGNPHTKWDCPLPFAELWAQYERVIKPAGAIVLFAQGMFTAQLMMSNPKLWRYNLVWDKCRPTDFLNANRQPLRVHEDICVFYKQPPVYNPQYEVGVPNHSRGNGVHRQTNRCYGKHNERTYDRVGRTAPTVPDNMKMPRSIVCMPREHETSLIHPTQKPLSLIRYLVLTYTDKGYTVLDSCMGSGTTAVACVMEGRHYIGFETNKEYYGKSLARISEAKSQPSLFNS